MCAVVIAQGHLGEGELTTWLRTKKLNHSRRMQGGNKDNSRGNEKGNSIRHTRASAFYKHHVEFL